MTPLAPLETLFAMDSARGAEFPLPVELKNLYGPLQFPQHPNRPYVIGNFVTTLDGVVSLNVPGKAGGGDISGFNTHDRLVMGLLRAVADAVVVGAGTLRAVPKHLWTAKVAYPAFDEVYQSLRTTLGKTAPPLNVIVTHHGELDLSLPVFQSGAVPVLIATTAQSAQRLLAERLPASVQVAAVSTEDRLSAQSILEAIGRAQPNDVILVEGGPQLMADFFAERCLDELFLTLAPQVAGRDDAHERPGLVAGKIFAPEQPMWGTLINIKRAESHLFLRYAFARAQGDKVNDGTD